MNERQLVDNILDSKFLESQFGRKTIQYIHREYNVGNSKNVDVAVETLDFLYLVEVKVNLVSYDIGQIMVYMTSIKHNTFKRIKGIIMYKSVSDKELMLITETINDFNIDVQLIQFKTQKKPEIKPEIKTQLNDFNTKCNLLKQYIKNLKEFKPINQTSVNFIGFTPYEWRKVKKLVLDEDLIEIKNRQVFKKPTN